MIIGDKLKEAREAKGLTLKDVQEKIKIRTKYLEALEEGNYQVIPGEAYIKAFIKSYAGHLQLDADELIKEYERLLEEERVQEESIETEEDSKNLDFLHNKTVLSSLIIIIVLIVLAFIVYSIFLLNDSRSEINGINESQYATQVNGSIDQESVQFNSQEEVTEEKDPVNEKVEEKLIKVIASERTWIQVLVDGEEKFEGILENGDTEVFSGKNNLQLKIGNAAGITIEKNGETLGPWGERGEVISKIIEF